MPNKLMAGMALAFVAAVLWALAAYSGLLLPPGFPVVELIWGRYGVQLVLLLALVVPFRGGAALIRTHKPRLQVSRGLMMLAMPMAFTLAVRRMSLAEVWAAIWFAPLLGMAFARYALKDSVSRLSWILALVATAGAVMVHGPTGRPSLTGLLAAGAAATAFGAFLVLTRALRDEDAAAGLFWTAACVFIPSSLIVSVVWQPLTTRAVAGVVAMGTLWLLVLWAIDGALRRAPLALLAPFLLTEIIWSRLLMRTPWTVTTLAGAIAVLACAVWHVRSVWRLQDATPDLRAEAT